jgi:hypothetical protein
MRDWKEDFRFSGVAIGVPGVGRYVLVGQWLLPRDGEMRNAECEMRNEAFGMKEEGFYDTGW